MITSSYNMKGHAWTLAAAWTLAVGGSLLWNLAQERQGTLEAARTQARVGHEKDVIYRQWSAGHGGTYVPLTEETPANPFLEHLAGRDLETPWGQGLTLVNPAYMTRQIHELEQRTSGIRGHITSLKPIRPQNAPDPWERKALQAFEEGESEVSSVERMDGRGYMRLMRPLTVQEGCLKCHARQGYQQGEIRGGISVSVPMAPLWQIQKKNVRTLWLGHGLLWLVGELAIAGGARRLQRSERKRQQAEVELRDSEQRLDMAIRGAQLGLWDWNTQTDEVTTNDLWGHLFGYAEREVPTDFEEWTGLIHPTISTRRGSGSADMKQESWRPSIPSTAGGPGQETTGGPSTPGGSWRGTATGSRGG